MKIVLPGGTGHIGAFMSRALAELGHEVVLSRRDGPALPAGVRSVRWDGRTMGPWAAELHGCDAVLNLAGRSVSCRYTTANLDEMMIYAHRFDAPNDETTSVIGGTEAGVPDYWAVSVKIATAWEREQQRASTPRTRRVALRTAIVMSPDRGGAFDMLRRMVRLGLGGPVAGGAQFVSWIHERDLLRAVEFLLDNEDLAGPVNLAAPHPLPHREFIRALRADQGVPFGLPATRWMAEIGAFVIRTDTELLLKSRRVVPARLLDAGFTFRFPHWPPAARELVGRAR